MDIPKALSESTDGKENRRQLSLISKNHIVYAGGNKVKAQALIELIDNDKLKVKPKYIVFIDNEIRNIENFKNEFAKDRNEHVLLFHYPNPPPYGTDTPCP